MADLIIACERPARGASAPSAAVTVDRLRRAALLLAPDHITPREPLVVESGGVVLAVASPQPDGVRVVVGDEADGEGRRGRASASPEFGDARAGEGGVCVGVLFGDPGAWWQVGAPAPDGTYALVRWSPSALELRTDAAATRTLWCVRTEEAFLASTSQRALVALLGGLELEPQAVSWMLSAGTLGPEVSWDARLRRLPPDARLTLDRSTGTVAEQTLPAERPALPSDRASQIAHVRGLIEAACDALDVQLDRWVLTLSGGIDSRCLLAALLAQGLRPRCLTWTTRAALRKPLSDVSIARLIARRLGLEHEIAILDPEPGDRQAGVERFIAAGEGRTDESAAYVDGLETWRRLFEAGVAGVLRGDEAFTITWNVAAHEDTRRGIGGPMIGDHPEDHLIRSLRLAPQSWPQRLRPLPGEDRLHFRARIILQAYNPIQGAALTGIKTRYLEVANPLLSRRVVAAAHALPAELIRGKTSLRAITRTVVPFVPTARSSSLPSQSEVLHDPEIVELVVRELMEPRIERILPADGARRVLASLSSGEAASPLSEQARHALKKASVLLPLPVLLRLKPPWKGPDPLPPSRLAYRAFLASRTVALLENDGRALGGTDQAG
jgi:hypothetical protein